MSWLLTEKTDGLLKEVCTRLRDSKGVPCQRSDELLDQAAAEL